MFPEIAAVSGLALLYLYHVNRGMKSIPDEVLRITPHRWTPEEIKAAYEEAIRNPIDVRKSLPPKQNRRYIVVGGSGLVGSWMARHLLMRGEDPSAIRILDLAVPPRDLLDQGVTFVQTNITDEQATIDAFVQPWPETVAHHPLTVFHNAAVIRPGERHQAFLPLCRNVNVTGTVHVLHAAKQSGASCFISTSSGSICIHSPSFWVAPWHKTPKNFVQVVTETSPLPQAHADFFSNYAVTKAEAERIVRAADDPTTNFRTGCIRPANGIYGIGDTDGSLTGSYLRNGGSPSWLPNIVHNFVSAENVSIAHLAYERCLINLSNTSPSPSSQSPLPDIGGQAFLITDPNPPLTYQDIYLLLHTLSKTPTNFPPAPAIPFLLLSYLIEWYALLQYVYCSWLPRITGNLAKLQPGLFGIICVHFVADDRRARLAPEQGGLGYQPPITTLYGMCKDVEAWNGRADAKGVVEEKGVVDGMVVVAREKA
ncbi:putative 3-beta hydroxysteroid dehydrogenase/isomerase family protein [Aspergillus ibericus CBS 121593]|uniref:NAD(P)-binding protein n=1 Tax=Aspergillus ibericus CBS 121593 TaxID=1448316 RepID=A0A395GI47_9EURO|nr:NAD(P)-binding protein [Aspergillus ibericus CBS 121593]RAK95105.1 NAD(P)-binding protein [Aspergillus ibericus CBS 121593]